MALAVVVRRLRVDAYITNFRAEWKWKRKKRPDLNELDAPEWAEVALHKAEWRELLNASLSGDGDSEPQAERGD
jgi:hypothetical protein